MTREMVLRNRLEMASHNFYCASANMLMTQPKPGMGADFAEYTAEVEMLRVWLKEFHSTNTNSMIEFVGHVNTISHGKTYDGKPLALQIEFEVDTGAAYLYGDSRIFNLGIEVQDWFVGENSRCGRYDIEKCRRNSRLIKITVDKINTVRSMEWAVADQDPAPQLSSEYWDCQCDELYIQHNSVNTCPLCDAERNEMPDSHQNEVDEGTRFAQQPA